MGTRDLMLYALGIGCTDPRYILELHPDFSMFPTYPIVLASKGESFDVLSFPSPGDVYFEDKVPGLIGRLDGARFIEKIAELPKWGQHRLNIIGECTVFAKKGPGVLVEAVASVVDDFGKLYYRMVSSGF